MSFSDGLLILFLVFLLAFAAFGIIVASDCYVLTPKNWHCTKSVMIGPEHSQHSECVQYSRKEEK